ncbi:MAG: HupE/UreJ family protein [Fluviicola sp.]
MKKQSFIFLALLLSFVSSAHAMPHSIMLLDIRKDGIHAKLSLPMKEFRMLHPVIDLQKEHKPAIKRKDGWMNDYLLDHLSINDTEGNLWKIRIDNRHVSHNELTYNLWLQPPVGSSLRDFTLNYDALIHRFEEHKLFLKVSSDWYGGMKNQDETNRDLGILMADPLTGDLKPLEVHLEHQGSSWNGFKVFVGLGMEQIKSGTDHLLFLVILMLSTALSARNGRWTRGEGTTKIVGRVLKIGVAFTIGYSLSLILGAAHWMMLPKRAAEIAIALTILAAAFHALRPIFPRKEGLVAVIFGLIHGLGFASAIADLSLDGERLLYSTLGFCIGVGLMLLFILLCIVPWFVLVSKYTLYKGIRIGASSFAILASLSWIVVHITDESNFISDFAQLILADGKWLIAGLVFLAIFNEIYQQIQQRKTKSETIG